MFTGRAGMLDPKEIELDSPEKDIYASAKRIFKITKVDRSAMEDYRFILCQSDLVSGPYRKREAKLADKTEILGEKTAKYNKSPKEKRPPRPIRPLHCYYEGCSKVFKRTVRLMVHLNTHRGRQSYRFPCMHEGCDKAFNEKQNLQTHMLIHTGKKPF